MKFKILLLTLTLGITLETLNAQDIHYTLYNMSPLTLNPALTGAYQGTARAGGIYRDQWASSVVPYGFKTPSVYVDAPIIRGFRKNDWVGIGFSTYNDLVGTSRLRSTASMFSASYHLTINKEKGTILTLGLQGGGISRGINTDSLVFGSDLIGIPNDETFERLNYVDFNAGVMLRSKLSEASKLEVGMSFNHLAKPKYGFIAANAAPGDTSNAGEKSTRPMRIVGHGTYEAQLTDKWSIAPTALFQTTSGATEIVFQGWGGYQLNPDYKLNFGAGFRFSGQGQILLGADVKENLRVAASYDISFSALNNATNGSGTFEIAAWYIFKIFKKPSVKPAILCPQF